MTCPCCHATFTRAQRKQLASELGRRTGRAGGKVKSAAKSEAARLNGAKGGRPRKVVVS